MRHLINLESYEKLERVIKTLEGNAKDRVVFYDTKSSVDNIKPLETYLDKVSDKISISIIDVSSLPKDARICLIARKDESA